MTTRRDLIKLGSALGLAGTVPTIAERIAAAEVLMQPISESAILDPGSFAVEVPLPMVSGELSNAWYTIMAPEEEADYVQTCARLERVAKENGVDLSAAVGDFEAVTRTFVLAVFDAGLRQGAAYENLRQSMVGSTMLCPSCAGTGRTKADRSCPSCGGSGTISIDA